MKGRLNLESELSHPDSEYFDANDMDEENLAAANEEGSPILRFRKRSSFRAETGDVTDGNIVV